MRLVRGYSALKDSSTGSTGGLIASLPFKFLNFQTARSTLAVTPLNLKGVLNFVGSKINSMAVLGSVDTRLCD